MSLHRQIATTAPSITTDDGIPTTPSSRAPGNRVVICGSMAFQTEMVRQKRLLEDFGINSLVPTPDSTILLSDDEGDAGSIKRVASMKYIRQIRDSKTFGILVMNLDKHGIHDYIGPNTFAEIAIALAHYKRIYLYQGVPAFYRDELTAWGAVAMNGTLLPLVNDMQQRTPHEKQGMLFAP